MKTPGIADQTAASSLGQDRCRQAEGGSDVPQSDTCLIRDDSEDIMGLAMGDGVL